jgi:hypothetical protein
MFACLFLGDSIAGDTAWTLGRALQNRFAVVARKGAGTPAITAVAPSAFYRSAVLSAGSNDADSADLPRRIEHLRLGVSARYVLWILPYDRRAAQAIRMTAGRFGDAVIDLAVLQTRDGVHPASYRGLAYALRRGGHTGD